MKTLLVGWDSVPWDMTRPLLERNELPNLQRLMDNGFSASLRSTMPPVTPVAWSSLITGKLPQKHGVYDWVWGDGDRLRVAASTEVQGTPFWRRLNDAGIRVGLVNVPLTYPPMPLDGFIVCGFGAPPPPAGLTHPKTLLDEIQEQFGVYAPSLSSGETAALANSQAIYEAERQIQAQQVDIALYLTERYPVDVLAINLMLFDHTNHRAKEGELVKESLRQLDEQLGRLLSGFEPDHVILFSDHGARRLRGQFLLGDWLCAHGYMTRQRRDEHSTQEFNFLLRQYLQDGLGLRGSWERVVRSLLRRTFCLAPKWIRDRFWQDVRRRLPDAFEHYWFREDIDPQASAVLDVRNIGTLYLKQKSEADHGSDSARDIKARLLHDLAQVADPETQTSVFREIYDAETLYGANRAGGPPDLILDYHKSGWALRREMGIGLVKRYPHFAYMADNPDAHVWVWHGDHDHEGICVVHGGGVGGTLHPEPLSIVDIPAILLHIHQVPIPEDFDGKIPPILAGSEPIERQPGDSYPYQPLARDEDSQETEDVLDRLRALGYVD